MGLFTFHNPAINYSVGGGVCLSSNPHVDFELSQGLLRPVLLCPRSLVRQEALVNDHCLAQLRAPHSREPLFLQDS